MWVSKSEIGKIVFFLIQKQKFSLSSNKNSEKSRKKAPPDNSTTCIMIPVFHLAVGCSDDDVA